MSGANSGKASFTNTDTNQVFTVQFNPKEFKLDDKANWKASDEHGKPTPMLTYEKGEPTTVTMDLIFDSSDVGDNVNDKFVIPLRDFLTADVPVVDKQTKQVKGQRPPYCLFTWGNFQFRGVVEKVSCTFLMFKSDGTPIRAKVQVGLKENGRGATSGGAGGGGVVLTAGVLSGSGTAAKTYLSIPGDSTTSIAARFGASPQDIAMANNISDPMEIPPGTPLVIPANSKLAEILARQSMKHTPAYWKNDRKLEPYDVFAVPAGNTAYVPSAFEDEGPVAQEYGVPAQPQIPYASFNQTYDGYASSRNTIGAFSPQEYGDYGESEFTFGKTTAQDYGDYGASETTIGQGSNFELGTGFGASENTLGTSGQGAEYGGFGETSAASAFDNDSKPAEQGSTATAQEYGGYAASETTAGTSGQGAEYGGHGESSAATAFDNDSKPAEQGATAQAQEYGGYAESEKTAGTSGQGAEYGGYGDSQAASAFDNTASPDGEGAATQGQSYGGYAESESTMGTSGQGAGQGYGAGMSGESTMGTSGQGAGQTYGQGMSGESTLGTSGEGAGQTYGQGMSGESTVGTSGQGAGQTYGQGMSGESTVGTSGQGAGQTYGQGLSGESAAGNPDSAAGGGGAGMSGQTFRSPEAGQGNVSANPSSDAPAGGAVSARPVGEGGAGAEAVPNPNAAGASSALGDALRRVKETADKTKKDG
jgi:LysM repeat protein